MASFSEPNHIKIKVIGVGGAGCNAVNYLHREQVTNVQLIACNTGAEAISGSPVPDKLLLGEVSLQEKVGEADPEKSREAALNRLQDIKAMLSDATEIVFVVAGMGGSAGTGAAPVIAQVAKKLGILTVGIVTLPFSFEGERKANLAAEGIKEMRKFTDALLILSNDNLRANHGELLMKDAFSKVDEFVANTVRAVADIVSVRAEMNVDIEDIKMVLADAGTAIVGTSITSGENRAQLAMQGVMDFPLLLHNNMQGAQKVLLSIMSGPQADLEMEELTQITEYIQEQAGQEAELIFGHGIDEALDNSIRVTVIATGFSENLKQAPLNA